MQSPFCRRNDLEGIFISICPFIRYIISISSCQCHGIISSCLSSIHIFVRPLCFLSACVAFFLYYMSGNVLYQGPFDGILWIKKNKLLFKANAVLGQRDCPSYGSQIRRTKRCFSYCWL